MKYSVIKDILLNKRCDSQLIPVSEEYKRINYRLEKFEEKIKNLLPEDSRDEIMWEYTRLQGDLLCEVENQSFTEGFKNGLLVGAEVFSELSDNGKN